MKIRYRQTNHYGCGLYSVANALNLPDYITPERLEISKDGNRLGQLSKWLQEDGYPFYIDVLYYNHLGRKLPTSALRYRPKGDNIDILPVLLNVRYSEKGQNHLVAGKIDKKGVMYLYDSLKEDIEITSLTKINKMYENVFGLFIFIGIDDGNYVFL